jgi:hypothetical protein
MSGSNSITRIPKGIAFPEPLEKSIREFAEKEDRTFSAAVVQLCKRALSSQNLDRETLLTR